MFEVVSEIVMIDDVACGDVKAVVPVVVATKSWNDPVPVLFFQKMTSLTLKLSSGLNLTPVQLLSVGYGLPVS